MLTEHSVKDTEVPNQSFGMLGVTANSPTDLGLCMTFFANSHGLCLDSCPLLGCLAHRYQIPEHFTALFALKHSNVALLSTHLFLKAFEQICRPDQRGQGLRKIDRQGG